MGVTVRLTCGYCAELESLEEDGLHICNIGPLAGLRRKWHVVIGVAALPGEVGVICPLKAHPRGWGPVEKGDGQEGCTRFWV